MKTSDGKRLTLRPATDADLSHLAAVYASTREEELQTVDWPPGQKAAFVAMQFSAQHTYYRENYPGAEWLVIEVDGVPAGRLYLHQRGDELRLVDIALLRPYRDQGIGERLVRDVIAKANSLDLPVRMHVEKFNPARELYGRLGFMVIEDRGVYHFMERHVGPLGG